MEVCEAFWGVVGWVWVGWVWVGWGGGGVLCAKLKLHKIAPNAQGIRHYDVTISGEVQSLALPLTLREVKQNHQT